jgi:hypothetical protein
MSIFPKIKFGLAALLATALLRPDSLLACAACYGQSDSPLAKAMNWGIFTLLGFVVCVLGGITMFFVHVGRKSANVRAAESGEMPNTKP